MKKLLPFVLLFFINSPAMAERVAHVIGVEGKVTVVREGNDLPVTRGERLYKSDQILTDRNSALELKMLDGSFINLGEMADMLLKSWFLILSRKMGSWISKLLLEHFV